jgi:CDP-diglyceride synthetase
MPSPLLLSPAKNTKKLWEDLPRRLLTIGVGVPALWTCWSYSTFTRCLFFQFIHVLMCIEWAMSLSRMKIRWTILFTATSLSLANIESDALFLTCLVPLVAVLTLFLLPQQTQQQYECHSQSETVKNSSTERIANNCLAKKNDDAGSERRKDVSITQSSTFGSSKGPDESAGLLQISILLGVLLLTVPNRTWLQLSQLDFTYTVNVLFSVWNGDTGALIAGRLSRMLRIQHHSVDRTRDSDVALPSISAQPEWLRKISPKKSMTGLYGGVLTTLLTYVYVMPFFWSRIGNRLQSTLASESSPAIFYPHEAPRLERYTVGALLGVAAILGDLCESCCKRYFGVKDTSKLLPGHGGILDRFDSSLLAVLFYHYYVVTYSL